MKLTSILLATVTAREDWQLPSEWAFCNAATIMPGVSDFYRFLRGVYRLINRSKLDIQLKMLYFLF